MSLLVFFFTDTATTEIYTLSLHDALPISREAVRAVATRSRASKRRRISEDRAPIGTALPIGEARGSLATMRSSSAIARSEEHTSELQSLRHLVCRLLLEKKKNKKQKRSDE